MKVAIFGKLKSTTPYRDWARCFRRRFWKETISEVYITDGNTVLNSYVKRYFNTLLIPVKEFNVSQHTDDIPVKKARNIQMIQEADIVIACVEEIRINDIWRVVAVAPQSSGKQAVILNVTSNNNKSTTSTKIKSSMDVKREELISVQEEVALVKHIQQFPEDCEKEKEKLLLVNKRFVRVIAERYVSAEHPIEELIEQGNKGLLFAVNKFEEAKGFKFISFAVYFIRQSMKRLIAVPQDDKNN